MFRGSYFRFTESVLRGCRGRAPRFRLLRPPVHGRATPPHRPSFFSHPAAHPGFTGTTPSFGSVERTGYRSVALDNTRRPERNQERPSTTRNSCKGHLEQPQPALFLGSPVLSTILLASSTRVGSTA